ncbi:hypothetical protein [Cellulomonas fimi]|uniref:Uncharacterized protein n=1 Tax=Cellulomonas fimi TaxID=1708 RepID=A0A7Y0LY29_CELFI|nr:hypothetical protein [Cellulomonas fimi]NMR19468.1 hypothetical protein [Cellulomonas fimi]
MSVIEQDVLPIVSHVDLACAVHDQTGWPVVATREQGDLTDRACSRADADASARDPGHALYDRA